MDLAMRTEYWDDPKALRAFKEFMVKIFGLDFSEWESGGYWDNAYTPFSFFNGETVVASVCIYLLDAVIDGNTTCVAQISGVGTLAEWRRTDDRRDDSAGQGNHHATLQVQRLQQNVHVFGWLQYCA